MKTKNEICDFVKQVRSMCFEQSSKMCYDLLIEMGATSKENALVIKDSDRPDFRIAYDYHIQFANLEKVYLYTNGAKQILMGDIDSYGDLNVEEEKNCNLEDLLEIDWVEMLSAINSCRED